jgi:hypothetical protein
VNIEGRSLDFLIDTGSAGSAIDLETARTLGLTAEGKERVEKNFRELVVDFVEIPTPESEISLSATSNLTN